MFITKTNKFKCWAVPVLFGALLSSWFPSAQAQDGGIFLKVGGAVLEVKVAKTQDELEAGLSTVELLGKDEGMLFVFPKKAKPVFHIKDVLIPLSIAFIDKRGKILKIENMNLDMQDRLYESPDKARYALEVHQGWFEKKGVQKGDRVRPA